MSKNILSQKKMGGKYKERGLKGGEVCVCEGGALGGETFEPSGGGGGDHYRAKKERCWVLKGLIRKS